jgi:hypothetical protein
MKDPSRGLFEIIYMQKIQMLSCYRRQNVLEKKHKIYFIIAGEGVTPSTQTPLVRQED